MKDRKNQDRIYSFDDIWEVCDNLFFRIRYRCNYPINLFVQ